MAKLYEPKKTYTFDYPQAIEFADTQMSIYWTADEINVEKDIQDMRVNMTEAEYHGVVTTLKLFTLYELAVGRDYWLNFIMKRFRRPDIERMASTFGFFELNVHAPFYNKINEALMLNTDEFYNSYVDNEHLKARMDFIEELVKSKDDLISIGTFSLVEGGVLYSNFGYLKHFQTKGKNNILNTVRGINFSVRDENLHCLGGSWLYRQLKKELIEDGDFEKLIGVEEAIIEASKKIYEHECHIIDMIFEKGEISGINKDDMKKFIKSRLNLCLSYLEISPVFEDTENEIETWFYDNINGVQFHDFFSGIGSNYNRNWDELAFTWRTTDGKLV